MHRPVRVPEELSSRNWNGEPHLLLRKTNRIQRLRDGGRNKTMPSMRRRYSKSHWSSRDNRLLSVHRDRIRFVPDLENKKILRASENLVRTSVEG